MAKQTPVCELFIDKNGVYTPVFKSCSFLSAAKKFMAFFDSVKAKNTHTKWSETRTTWYMLHAYNPDGSLSDYCAFTDRRLCTERGFLTFCLELITQVNTKGVHKSC